MKCEVGSGEWRVESVKCEVWSVECDVGSVEWRVRSVWSVKCEL